MIPTADQVTFALAQAAPHFGADPLRAFEPAPAHTKVRTLAARALIEAHVCGSVGAAAAFGFHDERSVSPSMTRRVGVTDAQVAAVALQINTVFAAVPIDRCSTWRSEEDVILREGVDKQLSNPAIALLLPGRNSNAIKNRRKRLQLPPAREIARQRGVKKPRVGAKAPEPTGPMTAAEGWTKRRKALCREHFLAGLSGSASARLLGEGTTKNMVVSQRRRQGLRLSPQESRARQLSSCRLLRGPRKPRLVAVTTGPEPQRFEPPRVGRITADLLPTIAPKAAPTDPAPLQERIASVLGGHGPLTPSSIAFYADAKELIVAQVLAHLEREGRVVAGEVPVAGRRAQRWSLTQAEAVAA